MIHYYRILNADSYELLNIYVKINKRHLEDYNCIEVPAFDYCSIRLSVTRPADETSEIWGSLFTMKNGEMIPISKFYAYGLTDAIPLYVAVTEAQVAELDAQFEQKLAAFNQSYADDMQEHRDRLDEGEELFREHELTIGAYEHTHPLTGSPKQVAWANQIRFTSFCKTLMSDPENALRRIDGAVTDMNKRTAKFWIDNRRALGCG